MASYPLVANGSIVELAPATFDVCDPLAWGPDVSAMTPAPQTGWTATKTNDEWIFAPAAAPSPTVAQQALAMLAGGLAVTSTSTPALDATYPCDAATISQILVVQVALLTNQQLPHGMPTMAWKDINGAPHIMTAAQLTALFTAIFGFVVACDQVISNVPGATLPAATATIA